MRKAEVICCNKYSEDDSIRDKGNIRETEEAQPFSYGDIYCGDEVLSRPTCNVRRDGRGHPTFSNSTSRI
jgi:hypothetical protein